MGDVYDNSGLGLICPMRVVCAAIIALFVEYNHLY